jgi:hypothetical protein
MEAVVVSTPLVEGAPTGDSAVPLKAAAEAPPSAAAAGADDDDLQWTNVADCILAVCDADGVDVECSAFDDGAIGTKSSSTSPASTSAAPRDPDLCRAAYIWCKARRKPALMLHGLVLPAGRGGWRRREAARLLRPHPLLRPHGRV